jgi:glutathione synthase/RimK-type ligase-like ATP-grasp enzyme
VSRRIAYLTARRYRGEAVPPGRVPPWDAADLALLEAAAQAAGLTLKVAAWDDPDWDTACEAALIRSTWDYHERPAAFLERLRAAQAPVFNAPVTVAWNLRKTYLRDLAEAGIATIDTHWVEAVSADAVLTGFDAFDAAELVIKPQVGAGARGTIRLKRSAWAPTDLAQGPVGPAMIQPFLPQVASRGETSLFFFGGAPAHAVRKTPPPGGWLANAKEARFEAVEASAEEVALAAAALAATPGPAPLYARVDLVPGGQDGRPRLIELELIEPALFLTQAPWAAPLLIKALGGALS